MSIDELGQLIGVNRSTINRYETGSIASPKLPVLHAIAKELKVNPMWLVYKSEQKHTTDYSAIANDLFVQVAEKNDSFQQYEIIGNVACGNPIINDEVITEMVELPKLIKSADRVLICKGDSMINAGIKDGDYVFVRMQPYVENGEIAVACINGEITLKRVYKSNGIVSLVAENPKYPPQNFSEESNKAIRVVGKAIAVINKL